MKLSTKLVYGLQFLLNLAESQKEYVQISEVVKKESLSEKYLESIASQLKGSGLVIVKRGAYGGYKLAKPTNQIELREVFESLEGLDLIPENLSTVNNTETSNIKAIRVALTDFQLSIFKLLSGKTLAEIAKIKNQFQSYTDYQI